VITKAASGDTEHQVTSVPDSDQWEGLGTRVLSAAVLGCVVIALVYVGGLAFIVTVVVAAVLMAYEWTKISGEDQPAYFLGGLALVVGTAVALVGSGMNTAAVSVGLAGALLLAVLAALQKRPYSWPALGVLYVGIPCASLVWLRGTDTVGMMVIFWSFSVVWATDIGAYAIGKTVGGPRLAPRISPKKTWSGLIGGTLCGTTAGAVVAWITELAPIETLALLSFALTFAAHGGDLVESAFKRRFNVKDSSNLIPGHGGILDRVDGLFFVWPAMVGAQFLHGEGFLPWVAR